MNEQLSGGFIDRREFLQLSSMATLAAYTKRLDGLHVGSSALRGVAQSVSRSWASGITGLGAGLELKEAGHDVTILEAQMHPGGRVYTIRRRNL